MAKGEGVAPPMCKLCGEPHWGIKHPKFASKKPFKQPERLALPAPATPSPKATKPKTKKRTKKKAKAKQKPAAPKKSPDIIADKPA